MNDEKKYVVESVKNFPYLDQADEIVDGFKIRIRLVDFDEIRFLNLPNDDPETIRLACELIVENREKTAAL